jgi:hypothetical protein
MNANKHLTPVFIIYVDGIRLDLEHEGALHSITIHDFLNGISNFTLTFETGGVDIWKKGGFSHGSEVSIHLGYKDDVEEVFFGEVTRVSRIGPENNTETLEISGHSVLHNLKHAARCRSFENKTPPQVIKTILDGYGLKAEVDDFGALYPFQSCINQTDFNYIVNFAQAYGKQIYASGKTVYVKDEITVRGDEIIYEWGKSLICLEVKHDISKTVSGINYISWDPLNCESFIGKATLEDLPVKIGGTKDWTKVSKGGNGRYVSTQTNMSLKDSEDAKQMALGQLQTNSYKFGFARGKAEGNYKLRPGMRVTLKMVGAAFEGEYMADNVSHYFDRLSGYITEFELKRNMVSEDYLKKSPIPAEKNIDFKKQDHVGQNAGGQFVEAEQSAGLTEMYDHNVDPSQVPEWEEFALRSARIRSGRMEGLPERGPCLFRSQLGIAETYAGRNLTEQDIRDLIIELRARGVLGNERGEFFVNRRADVIIRAGLEKLGVATGSLSITETRPDDGKIRHSNAAKTATHSLLNVRTRTYPFPFRHWQEGNRWGEFFWDPNDGSRNYGREVNQGRTRWITITPR